MGQRDKLNIFGGDFDTRDGTGCRDYVHVMDLARGHVSALDQIMLSAPAVRVYNLGTGAGHTVKEVVTAFEAVTGHKIDTCIVERRDGDVDTCYAATDKARQELEFTANMTLEQMCQDEYRWRMNKIKQ